MIEAEDFLRQFGRGGKSLSKILRTAADKRVADADSDEPRDKGSSRRDEVEVTEALEIDECAAAALRSLEAAGSSRRRLGERLSRKGYSPEAVRTACEKMERYGFLDDESYAQGLLRKGLDRGMGKDGCRRKLLLKGIPEDVVERVVGSAERNGDFERSAYLLAEKLSADCQGLSFQQSQRKIANAVRRTGHSAGEIISLLKERLKNAPDGDEFL